MSENETYYCHNCESYKEFKLDEKTLIKDTCRDKEVLWGTYRCVDCNYSRIMIVSYE